MDALELQAALVKLDPATTVTPIGASVKIVPPHHLIAFAVDIDESNLTLENAPASNDEKPSNNVSGTQPSAPSKLQHAKSTVNLAPPGHQNRQNHQHHQNPQQIGLAKCNMAEVR